MLKEHEGRIKEAPLGKKFQECYDIKRIVPIKEYTELYKKVKKKIVDLGVPILI
ncbi:MAG: monomethylamine:corrinoid methyltransferase [Candidatus Hadarchaeum sp.]